MVDGVAVRCLSGVVGSLRNLSYNRLKGGLVKALNCL